MRANGSFVVSVAPRTGAIVMPSLHNATGLRATTFIHCCRERWPTLTRRWRNSTRVNLLSAAQFRDRTSQCWKRFFTSSSTFRCMRAKFFILLSYYPHLICSFMICKELSRGALFPLSHLIQSLRRPTATARMEFDQMLLAVTELVVIRILLQLPS